MLIIHLLECGSHHTHRLLQCYGEALRDSEESTTRANQGTESLTQWSGGVVSDRFPKNGIYDGQQGSIIYCWQSGPPNHSINLCLHLILCCRVQNHHKEECHQDRMGLLYIISNDDAQEDIVSRTVSDAANKLNNTHE